MQKYGRTPLGFDSLGKCVENTPGSRLLAEQLSVGSIALSGPGGGFQLLCLCTQNTEPCAGPPLLSVAHITAGFCSFNAPASALQLVQDQCSAHCVTHAGQPDALRWMLGHPVTGSCHALGVWACCVPAAPYQDCCSLTGAVPCRRSLSLPYIRPLVHLPWQDLFAWGQLRCIFTTHR